MAVNQNMNILVVDDYQEMAKILTNLLKLIGFRHVESAGNGVEVLSKLNQTTFDFIISDWNMEPMTGIELLREVRSSERLKHLPFIMVTAESKSENVAAAINAGVSTYIVKPFTSQELKTKMESVLENFDTTDGDYGKF